MGGLWSTESKLFRLTPHGDVAVYCHTAEGVYQQQGVPSCIISGWPKDHQAPVPHQVVRVAIYLDAMEKPHLLLNHSVQKAISQGELHGSLCGEIGLYAHKHIFDVFCELMVDQVQKKNNQ